MNKLRNFLSSPPSGLPLDDVLELANEQLEDARNATTSVKALLLCNNAKAMIKEAENIFNSSGTGGHTLNNDIASLYYKHGKQLEELGHCDKAQRSYSKAKKWGYDNVASRHRISSQSATTSDLVRLPLCPPPALSAVPIISAVVFQSPTLNINATGSNNFKSVLKKLNGQEPQYIFGKDVVPPAAKPALPEPGDRIVSTSQLAYCLSLLPPEAVSKVDITEAEYAWSHHTYNDLEEQGRLRTLAKEVVRAFVRDELKTPEIVAEVVSLAAVLQQDEFRKLLQIFIDGIEQAILLDVHLLDGLAHIMRNHPQGDFDADDLIKILSLLGRRLKDTHRQSTQYTLRLATTVSRVLDSMVDSQVKGINRQQLHEPLSNYLKELQDSPDPCLVFQAAYSYQALLYIPDDESILKSMIRRTGRVIQGISGVVSAVKALDLNRFIEGLQSIQGGFEGMDKAISIIGEVYQNTKRLADSGHEFLVCLQEGFSFSRKSAWYPALRGLDTLLQEGRLTALEKLIRGAPCRHNLAFQWGVCQRLGEIAVNPIWDTDTRKGAVLLLVELYTDDLTWGQQVEVKQWILQILIKLDESTEGVVGDHVRMLLTCLETEGDHKKRSLYQAHMEEKQTSCLLTFDLPPIHESWLLDCVQDIPDVEGRLRRLKQERLKERGREVYIPPRAKHLASSSDDFDLTSKVQEFLKSNDKVFLLLGDSGAGKSTFSRALEISLWRDYKKVTGRIPLFIQLSTIEKPGQNLIAERLRKANFTESQISELKENREFILICDGYDESQQTQNLYTSNQLNQPGEWRVQMIISCRTEYNGVDYKDRFRPADRNNGGKLGLFQEAIIAPFNKNQIEDYVSQFVSWNKPSWETRDYLRALKKIPNLHDLVTNPFLLRITLDVIPKLLETKGSSSTRITRVELYDEFLQQWIERGKIRLGDMDLSAEDRKIFRRLSDSGFTRHCITYLKKLAATIYDEQEGNPVVNYSEHSSQRTWKALFFDNSDGKDLIRESIPLIRNGDQYQHIHKSILEYSLTLAVFDPTAPEDAAESTPIDSRRLSTGSVLSFEALPLAKKPVIAIEQPLLTSPFGRRVFVNEPSISQFFVERVQQQPIFKQQLLAVIERSKLDKEARIAAVNAITILVRAGVPFIGADLRGIKVPGADLSYGMFDSAQLEGADLRKANLRNIWLRQANLNGAEMTGVQFGESPLLSETSLVTCCAYSADGKMHAVGLQDGDISLYETSNWGKVKTLKCYGEVSCLVFSGTRCQIASGSVDGHVRLWEASTGVCVHILQGHESSIVCITFSPKGDVISSGSRDNTVRLWDVETGSCVSTLRGHRGYITSIVYSQDGDQIASGSKDKTIRLWDVESGECIHILQGHSRSVTSAAYSPSGHQIATGSRDMTVRLWNVHSGSCVYTLHGHSDFVSSITYSPKGARVASGSFDNTVRIWDIETGRSVRTLQGHSDSVSEIAYSPKGDQIASGSFDSTVKLWDVETGNCIHSLQGHSDFVTCVVYSPSGDQIASGSKDKTVRLWDVETSNCAYTLQGHSHYVSSIARSPKGDHVASGSYDKTLRLWDIEAGSCAHVMQGHTAFIRSVAFSPDGSQVASGSDDATVRLWDVDTGTCVYTLQGHTDCVTSVAYSVNGSQIASGSADKNVRLWDVSTSISILTLQGHTHFVTSVAYSPNGVQIASGSFDETVRVWNTGTGDCTHILRGHSGFVRSVTYSPDGSQIASGSDDKTLRLWDVHTGTFVNALQGHGDTVTSVAYSPEGTQIASGSRDKTLRLWAIETEQCLVTISGFNGTVSSVVYENTLNGQYLVTGCGDRSVRRWRVIKERGKHNVGLCWSSSHDALTVTGASFIGVRDLIQANKILLTQRGGLTGGHFASD